MILRRGSKSTQKSYTKKIFNSDNHDGVITHLEPDILECEVKWALGSRNKASGGGHGTVKGQFSFQSQRKAMPKNAQTTAQLHLSLTGAN